MGVLVVFGALGLARFGYSLILPPMQTALDLSNTQAGGLVTANLLGYVIFSAVGGALAAHYRVRHIIAIGLLAAGLGMLFTGLAGGFVSAVVWRALTGMGSGASNVPVTALMTAWFTARRRGLATGIVVSGSSVAIIITGPLVPRLLDVYGESGWRASWFLFGAVTIGLAICSYIVLRDRPGEVGQGLLGADSATGELAATRSGDGVHWKDVYRLPIVWHLGLVYIAFGFSYIIYMTFFAKSLMADGGYTKDAAGTLFMWVGWFSLFSGLIWGSVSDVIGRKRALIIVYLVHAVAFALFGLWPSPSGYSISAVLFGLAAWSIPAIMAAACGDLLGPRLAPVAFGFITLFFGLGQAIGPSVAGALADALGTFGPAYVLAAIVSLIGAGGVLALRAAPAASVRGGVGEVAPDRIR